jgi:uncharacterized protein
VGQTAWEELARTWVFRQGMHGTLSFKPEVIGSHWSRAVQADVVAVSWRERVVLVGECKWGTDRVNRQVVRQLIEQTLPNTISALPAQGQGWRAIPALFARAGATTDAQALLREHDGLLIDLPMLYADLGTATGES